ncbi:unnamed protein product [Blepharisma stoltei]|uniref:HMA domain-containing protein n=1 Tax=Blepharisma stoltei TaxID=1481888 RepID=A0AAU9J8L9_9CILI|nr:unnamed protein product [Blepharisma stoltei]
MDPEVKEILIAAQMSCEGCSRNIRRIIEKVDGVKSIDCNVAEQKCRVLAENKVQPQILLDSLKDWSESSGKRISLITE